MLVLNKSRGLTEGMMSLKKVTLIFMIMLWGLSLNLYGGEKTVLTLDRSVELALKNNPDIKKAEKEVAKSRAAIWEAYSTVLPSLDLNASMQHAWSIQENTIPNFLKPMLQPLAPYIPGFQDMPDYVRISFGLENTYRYGATLTQPLYLGGAAMAGIKIAYAAKRAAEYNLESKRQNLIYQTSNAFYGCLLARELVRVQEEALEQAKANYDVVLKKYNVGMASGLDKMRAQVEVANLKPEVISARNRYRAAITGLRTILGLDKDTEIDVQGALVYQQDDFFDKGLDEIQALALKNRPEVHALYEQKSIAAKGVNIARSSFLPKLFFQTDYSYLAMKKDYNVSQRDFSKGFTSAISLQIPIFHGFKSSKQYQKAKLDYKIVLDTEKQMTDGILAEVEMAYNKFQEAKEKFAAANESVSLAREALRLANLTYDEGASTQLDVLNSRLALTRAQLNYISSLYEYQMARYQLRKAAGVLKSVL